MSGFLSSVPSLSLMFGLYSGVSDVIAIPQSDIGRESDILWPRSSFPGQGFVNGFGGLDAAHQYWEWNTTETGNHVGKIISGISRDSTGAILGNATMQLFNTTTGLLVDTQTSDSQGNYRLSDPNNVSCFVVAYKSGGTDVAGTTKNNLTGT